MKPIPGMLLEDQPEDVLIPAVLWAEARGEPTLGKLAIWWVIRNRANQRMSTMKHEILRPLQFSSFNHDDPNRAKILVAYLKDAISWAVCEAVAAIAPTSKDPTGGATHYYNPQVASPPWGRGNRDWKERAVIGSHVFGVTPW